MIHQPRVMFRPRRRPLITAREFAAGAFIGFTVTLTLALVIGAIS